MLEVKETFKKEVKSLKDYILLITVDAKIYQKTTVDVVKSLVNEQNIPGVYVTLNKPYGIMQRAFENSNIDTRLIIFIDAASRTEARKVENCLYIGSPEKLSDMSVAMDQAVKALPTSDKFLIFDSLNTLSIFNKPGTVARFIHFLTVKMREWKVKGIIITLEKETDPALLDELTQFSDARIDLRGGS
ncbi:MAG: ATPase domain-containing protein [Nanoarchaeota archaeon]|nr:ATPase domain-containing protein [Nanoarchaeota archaeon]